MMGPKCFPRAGLLLVAIIGACGLAEAATLRPIATLDGPLVHLRDLFEDAGPNAGRVLGPGPGPGGRIIVGASQLGAIARQFGVDWRPASSGDRAILEWPGKPLRREDALEAVRAAVVAAGADPECVIEMAGFTPPLVPLGSSPLPARCCAPRTCGWPGSARPWRKGRRCVTWNRRSGCN